MKPGTTVIACFYAAPPRSPRRTLAGTPPTALPDTNNPRPITTSTQLPRSAERQSDPPRPAPPLPRARTSHMIRFGYLFRPDLPLVLYRQNPAGPRAGKPHADHPFSVEWHPFQLNPDMPARRHGPPRPIWRPNSAAKQQAVEVYARIEQAAHDAGLEIDFAAIQRTPNTLDAHRLIHWAGLEGRQIARWSTPCSAPISAMAAILAMHATRWSNCRPAGMDAGRHRPSVGHRCGSATIWQPAIWMRGKRASTRCPTFLIAQQYVMSGAQPIALWAQGDRRSDGPDQSQRRP